MIVYIRQMFFASHTKHTKAKWMTAIHNRIETYIEDTDK